MSPMRRKSEAKVLRDQELADLQQKLADKDAELVMAGQAGLGLLQQVEGLKQALAEQKAETDQHLETAEKAQKRVIRLEELLAAKEEALKEVAAELEEAYERGDMAQSSAQATTPHCSVTSTI